MTQTHAGGSQLVADDLIAVAAFRYAMGRMTYITEHVGDWLIANSRALKPETCSAIAREIDAEPDSRLGMECDREIWRRVANTLRAR